MASGDLLEGIDLRTSTDPPDRVWARWWGRAVILLLGVVCLLGLLNVFGQVMTSSQAHGSVADLRVEAPATLRGGLLYQVVVHVTAHSDVENARLIFSSGWFSGLTTNAEVPQPGEQQSDGGRTVFTLGHVPAGATRTLRVYFQVNPTTIAWHRPQQVELDDGETRLATVSRTINIYP